METIEIIGRILIGGLVTWAGLNHFMHMKKTTMFAKSKKVPMPGFASFISGVGLLLGGLGILTWTEPVLSMWIVAVLLFLFAVMVHQPWKETGEKKMMEMHYMMGNFMSVGLLLILISMIG
jgi:putative oxidoreductase